MLEASLWCIWVRIRVYWAAAIARSQIGRYVVYEEVGSDREQQDKTGPPERLPWGYSRCSLPAHRCGFPAGFRPEIVILFDVPDLRVMSRAERSPHLPCAAL